MKRVLVIEDHLEIGVMKQLFSAHKGTKKYDLVTYLDLSDERVYQRHLPEGFDVYWVHISAVENEALPEIKGKQPWSKIVIRSNQSPEDSIKLQQYFVEHLKADRVISKNSGIDEEFVLSTLNDIGIEIILGGNVK